MPSYDPRRFLTSFQGLWTHHKMTDFPLSQKFRTLGILSGSVKAQINGQEHARCEFCNAEEAGQNHIVLRCETTAHLRSMAKYKPLQHASIFTRCTGIPTGPPLLRPSTEFCPLSFHPNPGGDPFLQTLRWSHPGVSFMTSFVQKPLVSWCVWSTQELAIFIVTTKGSSICCKGSSNHHLTHQGTPQLRPLVAYFPSPMVTTP